MKSKSKITYKKIFTTSFLLSSIKKNKIDFFNKIKDLVIPEEYYSKNINSVYNFLYKKIVSEYRYEYVFKNEFLKINLNNILNKKNYLFSEVELFYNGEILNILDLLFITEKGLHAIEIKSDFDTFQRLDHQLDTYCKLFQFVSVFVSKNRVEDCINYIDGLGYNNVGIIALDINSIETIRSPLSNFDILNKDILLQNVNRYNLSAINEKLLLEDIYNFWEVVLINKFVNNIDFDFVKKIPSYLKFYAYSHSYLSDLKKYRIIKSFS